MLSPMYGICRNISKPSDLTHSKQDQPQYKLLFIPRARRVHQSLLSTPPDAVKSLLACIRLVSVRPLFKKGAFRQPFVDLLILNGPGTCVILCATIFLNRVSSRFLLKYACIILIRDLENLTRISLSDYLAHGLCTLSLSPVSNLCHFLESCSIILPIGEIVVLSPAKITYPPSSFVVQWPGLVQPGSREIYRGCLV